MNCGGGSEIAALPDFTLCKAKFPKKFFGFNSLLRNQPKDIVAQMLGLRPFTKIDAYDAFTLQPPQPSISIR